MGGAALVCCAATVVFWCAAVAWPACAAVAMGSGGKVPATFDGNRVAAVTVAWSIGVALAAAVPGWIAGRAMRTSRARWIVLAASVIAIALPAYAVFWTWWQAAGPGSMLGDWAARTDHSQALREVLLAVGLVSWCWPLIAWCVAGQRSTDESEIRELHSVDAAGWRHGLARAWRTDWPGLAQGVAIAAFVVAGSTVAFDLAQVSTFGFELRTLDAQAAPVNATFRAALPAVVIAALGALILAAWPVARPGDSAVVERQTGSRVVLVVIGVTLIVPVAVLLWSLVSQGALWSFGTVALPGVASTLLTAGVAGVAGAVVALGHLAMCARGQGSDSAARKWRVVERVTLAGWLCAALVPGTVYALALTLAYNREGMLLAVYDTPAIVALAELGRYGAGAAWIGRLAARREPAERRLLRLGDGAEWRGLLTALAPQARAAALGAALLVTALGAGEVVVTAKVEPPGWEWAASRLLNAIHYQQPDAVLGTLLALAALGIAAGVAIAWSAGRLRALGRSALVLALFLMPALMLHGCRENPSAAGTLPAVRSFGSSGPGPGFFEYPRALEIDPRDGTVLVIDRQARVHRFTPEGKFVGGWRMPDYAAGRPTGFHVCKDGTVLVADTHYHRVIAYTPDGTEIRRWGEYGTGPGQFIFPCDVTIGPDGLVYVAEFGSNDRIQVFTPTGEFVRAFGTHGRAEGQFDRPQCIEFSTDGELYVADACNHRVQVLDSNGAFKRVIGGLGREPGQFLYPYGIRLLPDGTMLVAEFGGNRVQRLDARTGRAIDAWHQVSGAPMPAKAFVTDGVGVRPIPATGNDLRIPWAVAWKNDEMFVLDSGHARVLVAKMPLMPERDAAK